ncbi:hypothetical protein Ancab_030991, partial [Ancistrocladus abbreviatus]
LGIEKLIAMDKSDISKEQHSLWAKPLHRYIIRHDDSGARLNSGLLQKNAEL